MMRAFKQLLVNDYLYVRKHPQVIMTVLLIIVIPIAFLVSGQQFLGAAKDNQERLEQDRIGLLHDVFASALIATHFDTGYIQNELTSIARKNSDITQFQVLKKEKTTLTIVASLKLSELQTSPHNESEYRLANVEPNRSFITPYVENGNRYWRSYRLVMNEAGEEYYIFTETSLSHIDSLFAERIITAYYWLFGILAVVLFLVLRHIRLIDYSYLYRETKRENEMKDMFINMIAHELRAPLTAMRGYASMIREDVTTPVPIKEYGQKIEDSAERLVLIVNDLLDVARIHSGKLSITKARADVQSVITAVLEVMQAEAREKGITVTQESPIMELILDIDTQRLHQALTNLVSNALKYTKSGSIAVSFEERDDRVEIRVKDTGMGISAENQKSLFSPFFRVTDKDVDQTIGTGLGMWITKQLIELMGGSIAVESIKGVGTHVVITLPKTQVTQKV